MEHATLSRQRRMRPAIARLIAPVYPSLHDHPDVEKYPPPRGIPTPLFFVTHGLPETFDPESRSRSNDHEAQFVTAQATFLLRSGYQPSQITVLTTYCGQLFNLRKRFRAPGGERGLDEIRMCTVDQYQGEENDVILLSLVRSNSNNDIGFLSVQNRMVVALSRAKHCMYIIGNAHLLAARSNLWCAVLSQLEHIGCLGPALPVVGPAPQHKIIPVTTAADFNLAAPKGGRQPQKQQPGAAVAAGVAPEAEAC